MLPIYIMYILRLFISLKMYVAIHKYYCKTLAVQVELMELRWQLVRLGAPAGAIKTNRCYVRLRGKS